MPCNNSLDIPLCPRDTIGNYVIINIDFLSVNAKYNSLFKLCCTTFPSKFQVDQLDAYDEFHIQCAVVQSDGCFVSSRCLCRKNTYRVTNVIRALTAMNRPRQHPLYVGTFVRVSERVKIFYKCPPQLVSSEALRLYGVEAASYARVYQRSPRPSERTMINYVEAIIRKWPFDASYVPFDSFQLTEVNVIRLRSVVGVDVRPTEGNRSSDIEPTKFAEVETSFYVPDTAVETLSLDSSVVSPLPIRDSSEMASCVAADISLALASQISDDMSDQGSSPQEGNESVDEVSEISHLH